MIIVVSDLIHTRPAAPSLSQVLTRGRVEEKAGGGKSKKPAKDAFASGEAELTARQIPDLAEGLTCVSEHVLHDGEEVISGREHSHDSSRPPGSIASNIFC